MTTPLPIETTLTQGQTLRTRVSGGTHLVITKGAVHLERQCTWLGESFPTVGTTLTEGHVHCVDQAGWVTVMALSEARVLQHVPASSMAQALGSLRVQSQRFMQWLHHTPKHVP